MFKEDVVPGPDDVGQPFVFCEFILSGMQSICRIISSGDTSVSVIYLLFGFTKMKPFLQRYREPRAPLLRLDNPGAARSEFVEIFPLIKKVERFQLSIARKS